MALKDLKTDISGKIKKKAHREITNILQAKKYHLIKISKPQYSEKMKRSIKKAIIKKMDDDKKSTAFIKTLEKKELTNKNIGNSFIEIMGQFTSPKKLQGIIYYEHSGSPKIGGGHLDESVSGGNDWVFLVPPAGGYKHFISGLNTAVYKKWAPDKIKGKIALTEKEAPSQKPETPTKDDTIEGSHGDFTAWAAFLELKGNDIQAEVNLTVEEFDIAQRIIDALDIGFDEKTILKDEIPSQRRVVTINLGKDNVSMRLDAPKKKTILDALDDVISQAEALGEKGALAKASVPFKEQAAAAIQYKVMRELIYKSKKAGLKVKVKGLKKPKVTPDRSTNIKQPKKSKIKRFKVTIPEKITVAKYAKERGKGVEASTNAATELAKLRAYIQSRLPAEVRRNMGKPALRNRTGRFSNSVQLLSLRQSKSTIMAKYTYLLSPYATFENTGTRRWPMAYNPKPLIAKSIRNLAKGRIEQKLTVRRV